MWPLCVTRYQSDLGPTSRTRPLSVQGNHSTETALEVVVWKGLCLGATSKMGLDNSDFSRYLECWVLSPQGQISEWFYVVLVNILPHVVICGA